MNVNVAPECYFLLKMAGDFWSKRFFLKLLEEEVTTNYSINHQTSGNRLIKPAEAAKSGGQVTCDRSQVTGHMSQVTGYRSKITDNRSQVMYDT